MLTKIVRNYSASSKNVLKSKKNYESLSACYDKLMATVTFGRQRHWIEELICQLPIESGTRILDMAGGQGAVSFAFLERARRLGADGCVSYVCDVGEEMMAIGKNKARRLNHAADAVRWVHGDIHQVPFDDAFFDACVLFFGIRKMDLARVFGEAHRVLKPGGHFFVFDMAQPNNPIVRWLYWQFYIMLVVPRLLRVSRDQIASYKSAVDDVMTVPPKEEMVRLLKSANFEEIKSIECDLGIEAYYTCLKV